MKTASIGDVLRQLARDIPGLEAERLALLAGAVALVPAHTSRDLGVEYPLANAHLGLDLSLGFTSPDSVAAAVEAMSELSDLVARACWEAVGRIAALWQTTPLYSMWLELDLSRAPRPAPSCFVGAIRSAITADGLAALTEAAHGVPFRLGQLLELLPASADTLQLGMMLSRESARSTLRICAHPVALTHTTEVLERLGWPGDRAACNAELTAYAPVAAETLILDIDVDPSGALQASLGLELRAKSRRRGDWRQLLEAAVSRGAARPEHAAILRSVGRDLAELGPRRVGIALDHLKLSAVSAPIWPAKAYLAIQRRP